MSGSIDLSTGKGIVTVLLLLLFGGLGGGSVYAKFFDTGKTWEDFVVFQAVTTKELSNLNGILSEGFEKLTDAQKDTTSEVKELRKTQMEHAYMIRRMNEDIDALKTKINTFMVPAGG